MFGAELSIFEDIGKTVVQDLESDENFSDDLVCKLAQLFESGEITDTAKVITILKGDPSEDSAPTN